MLKPTYRATAHTVRHTLKTLAAITHSEGFFYACYWLVQSTLLTMLVFSAVQLLEGAQ